LLGREAVERERVVADDELRVQRDAAPQRRHLLERLGRDREPVTDAARGLQHDVIGAPDRDLARDQRDHGAAPVSALPVRPRSGAWLAWQMPTASASAAWSASGPAGSESSTWTIRVTCALAARPLPQTAPLTCWGV